VNLPTIEMDPATVTIGDENNVLMTVVEGELRPLFGSQVEASACGGSAAPGDTSGPTHGHCGGSAAWMCTVGYGHLCGDDEEEGRKGAEVRLG